MSDGKKKFPVDAWYATSKVVFMDDGFAQIEKGFSCALGIESAVGDQFFLCQKITLQDGSEYVLERYNFAKNTLFYRRLR